MNVTTDLKNIVEYFKTEDGIIIPAVTAEQMKKIDRIAIEESGPNLWQMMENAGRSLAELTLHLCSDDLGKKQIVILAGKGNNGGGGICAARHLMNHKANVKLVLIEGTVLGDVAHHQLNYFETAGGRIYSFEEIKDTEPDIILDAMLGYSLKGELIGHVKEIVVWANKKAASIISLDVPSGISPDGLHTSSTFIKASATLTLALPKIGLNENTAGEIYLADLGIPKIVFEKTGIRYDSPFTKNFMVRLYPI
jgi:NAD(P)H-hydrate epimerase